MSIPDFYGALRGQSTSTTTQIPISEYVAAFAPTLEKGQDILYLGFSSGLSGTVQSAMQAVQELRETYPERRVEVVDSLCASLGQGLFVWHVAQMKKQGKPLDETAKVARELCLKVVHWFTVDDLQFLRRGGRLSGASAIVGTMLGIKPVLHFDDEGHLMVVDKVRGRRSSLNYMLDQMEKTAIDPGEQTIFISHGDAKEDAEYVADEIRRRFGTKNIYINFIGPIIGGHSGPGTIALFYLSAGRE